MKIKSIILLVVTAILASCVTFTGRILMDYLDSQNAKFNAAVEVVEKQMYRKLLQAQRERNIYKVKYYRYQMENAGKLVLELGADHFLENEKTR